VITIEARRPGVRAAVALAVLCALAAASCNKNANEHDHEHQQTQTVDIETVPEVDRALNQVEMDSLRAMKITHRITRDEYWDLKGGVIANDRIEVWYPLRKIYVLHAMGVLKWMDMTAGRMEKKFGRLPEGKLVVLTAPNLDTFRAATGRDWWHYSKARGDTLDFQTPMTLYMRGLLMTAASREYGRWAVGRLTHGKAPQWLVWGTASYFANERDVFRGQRKEYGTVDLRMDLNDMEKQLAAESDRLEFRRANYNAFLMVTQLVETHGMPSVAAFILAIGETGDVDAAARQVFSKPYTDVLTDAQAWKEPVDEPAAESAAPAPAGDDHTGE
jgi:hypothetical protein